LDLPLLDCDIEPVSEPAVRVLRIIGELSAQNPKGEIDPDQQASYRHKTLNSIVLGLCAVSSLQVAIGLGVKERRARYILDDLLHRGLVERVGKKGGWKLTGEGERFVSLTPQQQEPAAAESVGG
jgi:predicted HTH transcriptional regulator